VVHTYSGFENKAKKSLEEKIKQNALDEYFGESSSPWRNVVEMVKGEKRASKRKFFPGYILVQMELNDRTWHLVKNTPKITGFVGNATRPPAVSEHEIARLTTQLSEGALKPSRRSSSRKVTTSGWWTARSPTSTARRGSESGQGARGGARLHLRRATPVELDFMQVEKT